ncbi:MAG: restriction endonuclease subunit S [Nitrosomonadaceae bacterium]|nr:restriction endonuclease subunit S [Nitrosomonadaceae bacterium]
MNVPKLRFKDFTDKWENRKIKDFLLSHKGGAPLRPADFVKNSGYEVIPKKAISSGGKLSLDLNDATFCSESFFKSNARSVVDESYLITTLRDLVPSGPSIGYIVKFTSNKSYLLAQGVYGIKIDKNLDESFLIHYSNTDKYRVMMQTMMVGSTQVHIRNSDFFKTPINIPSLPEQTKIANFLTAIDEKITQLTQKCDLLAQYKKGVMQQIFSQKLRFKDDDGREFPEWKKRKIGELGRFIGGGTPTTQNDEFWNGNIPWISSSDLSEESIFQIKTTRFISEKAISQSATKLVPKNSILIVSRVGVGKVAIAKEDICTSQDFTNLVLHSGNHVFFAYLLKTKTNKLLEFNQGTSIKGFVKSDLEAFEIYAPVIQEQTKIANFLTAIDDKITQAQTQLEAVKLYKKGLLQQMFV